MLDMTLFLNRELVSRAKSCLVSVFPDIVKDCPTIRNLPKIFLRSFGNVAQDLSPLHSQQQISSLKTRQFLTTENCAKHRYKTPTHIQCESKNPPQGTWHFSFFHKQLRIFNQFFTHLLYVPIYARLQIFIQLSKTLMKLCHIKRDYLVHVICSKCPSSAETHAYRRLRKSLIALLIVICGKSL